VLPQCEQSVSRHRSLSPTFDLPPHQRHGDIGRKMARQVNRSTTAPTPANTIA
jgi:hypothetical protein